MDLSFIIPVYNEEACISNCINSLLEQSTKGNSYELIFVDGDSCDKSLQIINNYINSNRNKQIEIRVLSNPKRSTPYGFNIGIDSSKGKIIGFGGAHTLYPRNYFSHAIEIFNETDASVVGGGHENIIPDVPTIWGSAVALLYKSPIGSGIAKYHRLTAPGYVDTVYGGFYRKEIFSTIGKFNVNLKKNQDNELNSRILKSGYKIYFHPKLNTDYIIKTNVQQFLKRGYTFGRYHFNTLITTPESFKLRYFIPGIFVLYLLAIVANLSIKVVQSSVIYIPLISYFTLLFTNAAWFGTTYKYSIGLMTIFVNSSYHISYGLGVLIGILFPKK